MFKVIPIGVNGLYATENSPSSCYLLNAGGKNILLDVGSGAFARLQTFIKPEDLDAIIISHFHFDHFSDIGVFGYYMQSKKERIKLFAPNSEEHIKMFSLDKRFDTETVFPYKQVVSGDIVIKFIPCRHPIETYALKVEYGGRTFCYTADTNDCAAVDEMFSSDLVLCDSAFTVETWAEGKPHLSAKLCAEYAKKHGAKTLLTHLDPSRDRGDYLKEASLITDLCSLAEVGKEYEV